MPYYIQETAHNAITGATADTLAARRRYVATGSPPGSVSFVGTTTGAVNYATEALAAAAANGLLRGGVPASWRLSTIFV